jgi:hypothetical protein
MVTYPTLCASFYAHCIDGVVFQEVAAGWRPAWNEYRRPAASSPGKPTGRHCSSQRMKEYT